MKLKDTFKEDFEDLEVLDTDFKGRMPINKAMLAVLLSIDKTLKRIEVKK